MSKPKVIPFSNMHEISEAGVFVKRFGQYGTVTMRPYAHRDDYYIVVVLTEGAAGVEIDFERKELSAGEIMIVSPWQVHSKPSGEEWRADGWMLAFTPEMLTEAEARIMDEYAISPSPFNPGKDVVGDIVALCSMLGRNIGNRRVATALAMAVKSFVLATVASSDAGVSDRYKKITLRLRKLLDSHLKREKSPAAYASMLNISEVYLNEAVKGTTGLSAGAYIRSRVIIEARRQLTYSSKSAKEVAYSLGYDDYAYFSKLFKKWTGVSPADYRLK